MSITPDPWITSFVGRETFCVSAEDLLRDETQAAVSELTRHPVFLYTKIDVDACATIACAESLGFNLIETNITLDKEITPVREATDGLAVGLAESSDEDGAVKVARENIIYSRFHTDLRIGKNIADNLKGEWVRNYFKGLRGDGMIVTKKNGLITGFLQYFKNDSTITIDLIAVDKNARREGIAGSMISYLQRLENVSNIMVGTQLANIPSLRLYEKLGFRIVRGQYVFHLHEPE